MSSAALAPYVLTAFDLVLRWIHVIVGIAWIGSSFYFMWLDARLNVPLQHPQDDRVAGDLWALHSGSFYHSQKYQIAPGTIPAPLHRFRWEAYTTWLSGMALLTLIYYFNADLYLVNGATGLLNPVTAVAASVALLIAAWVIYQLLCVAIASDRLLTPVAVALVGVTAWLVAQLFTGRGAFMQLGAMLGTLMAGNVFFVIMPAQRAMLQSMRDGGIPDASPGSRAKRRSVHNNYLTLPVVLCMLSPHYPLLYGQRLGWLHLVILLIAGATARHCFNLRNAGRSTGAAVTVLILLVAMVVFSLGYATRPGVDATSAVTNREIETIIGQRCRPCHSLAPTFPGTVTAPAGVVLDDAADIRRWARRIEDRVLVSHTMPNNNATGMTDDERRRVGAWLASGMQADGRGASVRQ